MTMLYRVDMNDGSIFKVNAPWPDPENGAKYTIGAMFYVHEEIADEETLPEFAHHELWASPLGVQGQPPDDADTYCLRVWHDGPVKYTYEHWKWADAMKAIAMRLNLLLDDDDEVAPPPPSPQPAGVVQPAALAAPPPG